MECIYDGKTKKITRRREECFTGSRGERMGDVSGSGTIDGTEPIRISSENSQRRSVSGSGVSGESSIGKILKRLKFIQDQYISYIKGHQQRLEARLDESREKEAVFLNAIHELEQDIYDAISTEEIKQRDKPQNIQ